MQAAVPVFDVIHVNELPAHYIRKLVDISSQDNHSFGLMNFQHLESTMNTASAEDDPRPIEFSLCKSALASKNNDFD